MREMCMLSSFLLPCLLVLGVVVMLMHRHCFGAHASSAFPSCNLKAPVGVPAGSGCPLEEQDSLLSVLKADAQLCRGSPPGSSGCRPLLWHPQSRLRGRPHTMQLHAMRTVGSLTQPPAQTCAEDICKGCHAQLWQYAEAIAPQLTIKNVGRLKA